MGLIEILLVEDNLGDIRLFQEALKEIALENNLSVQALHFLRRQRMYKDAPRPDIIVLDLNLPRINGHEVLAQIKQDKSLKCIPVLILTTSNDRNDVRVSYDLHANCYITKPSSLSRLVEIAQEIEKFWFRVVTLSPI
jgi:CheY-like chemotaxis protein